MTSATLHRGMALAVAGLMCVGATAMAPPLVPSSPTAPPHVAQVLDTYAAGRFDEAVSAVARAGDQAGRSLRSRWMVDAPIWINAEPCGRQQRLLVAAALALETECVRVERGDWDVSGHPPCPGSCVLDWAQARLVERGQPDRAEHAWYLAAAALVAGVPDWGYLSRPAAPQGRHAAARSPDGLTERALVRFPADPHLRLEQAMAAAASFTITADGGRYVLGGWLRSAVVAGAHPLVSELLLRPRRATTARLEALVPDLVVGTEAALRLGYLHWVLGQDDAARAALTSAALRAEDADVRYLARFLLGWTALARGDSDSANLHLRAALGARPDSQSAALALASLQLQRGDAQAASDIAQASLDARPRDDDPWRLFVYGHYQRLPALVADLRRLVRP